jgi:2'-5' RNA ligase
VRLFLAIELPERWRERAAETGRAIDAVAPGALRLVHPDLMHLTVRFLGEVADESARMLHTALRRQAPPIDLALQLGPAGTFGSPARTSVVWHGIGGDIEGLRAAAGRVERAAIEAGLPGEGRELRPHLTVARVRREAPPEQRRSIAAAVRALPVPDPDPFRARSLVLVRSYLGGPRPRYEVLASF